MSFKSDISLIDLSQQLPFNIDDTLKKQLCFGESLVISSGHAEGNMYDVLLNSECSSSETSVTEETEKAMSDIKLLPVTKQIDADLSKQSIEDDDNFHFYFFPDCTKPMPTTDSKSSLIIKDGIPQMNPIRRHTENCTCKVDKKGRCECMVVIPCLCGAEEKSECVCASLEKICICNERRPDPICSCKDAEVCTCIEGKCRVLCTCDKIDIPCICHGDKFPQPICICKHKPVPDERKPEPTHDYEVQGEIVEESSTFCSTIDKPPCDCQTAKARLEKSEQEVTCPCELRNDTPAVVPEPCSSTCQNTQECTCNPNAGAACQCFPPPIKVVCTCGNPKHCKCFHVCECTEPCICDVEATQTIDCSCYAKESDDVVEQRQEVKKLKRVRAGKHGYRWCHDVDPRHTYFGYGYGRHDKIAHREEKKEKNHITDAKQNKDIPDTSVDENVDIPVYKKKIKKLSLDCCSAVGGITINVETLGEDKGKFLIQVLSHSSKEAAKTGSKFVSIVDCKLHTLEENRTEYIQSKDTLKEKRNYMAICDNGYYNKVTRICGDRHLIKRFYHTFEDARNFLLEGANVVLMRYVALTRYKGCIKTDTVLIGGLVCQSIYVCLGVSNAIVNGRPFFVEKVERHIIEPSGYIHQTLLVLTLRGYVVSQEWANNSYIIHINPLLRVVPERDEIEPHEPLRETWRSDLQLLSDYLDFKASRSSEGGRYVSENGELTATIRDYLQAVLLLRPSDALHFTRHYFGAALSALDLPHNEFFDSSTKHVRYFFFEE